MKYRHFIILRNSILGGLGIGAIAGGYHLLSDREDAPAPAQEQHSIVTTQVEGQGEDGGSLYRFTPGPEITTVHQEIMDMQKGASLSEGKPDPNNNGVKLFKKMPTYQLDFRCDKEKGFDYYNRVKIDWDYDKNWDEKWDFRKNGSVKRQCSTNDDNTTYDLVQETVDGKWQAIGSGSVGATQLDGKSTNGDVLEGEGKLMNTKQAEVRGLQRNTPLSAGKHDPNNNGLKHYIKQPGYFVDLRCDKEKGFDYWNRVKIDWDKDKNWDEKWDVRKDGSIKRQFSSNDDNNYDVVEELK